MNGNETPRRVAVIQFFFHRFQAQDVHHRYPQPAARNRKVRKCLLVPRVHFGQHHILRIVAAKHRPRKQVPVARLIQSAQKSPQRVRQAENLSIRRAKSLLVAIHGWECLYLDQSRRQFAVEIVYQRKIGGEEVRMGGLAGYPVFRWNGLPRRGQVSGVAD